MANPDFEEKKVVDYGYFHAWRMVSVSILRTITSFVDALGTGREGFKSLPMRKSSAAIDFNVLNTG